MRVLVWHGWLLDGTGSNVYTAKVAEVWRRSGHDVVLVCQERHVDRFPFVDAVGVVADGVVSEVESTGAPPEEGSVVLLRPDIGALLPVFVFDEYEGFEPKRFVELSDEELNAYLERNVRALAAAAERFPPDVVVAGHVVPGPVIARRAIGAGTYVAKVHGSDLEYAVRLQPRYRELAREGLEGARAISGASHDVLRRAVELVPGVADRIRVIPPGVDIERWQPRPRREALLEL
ncbi:MAG TPA: glycosyltransferase, partial [Actinomycetota bacterium]|nr:glycosyltransferase [Actinomycetota bacterium]